MEETPAQFTAPDSGEQTGHAGYEAPPGPSTTPPADKAGVAAQGGNKEHFFPYTQAIKAVQLADHEHPSLSPPLTWAQGTLEAR